MNHCAILRWYQLSNITEVIGETPIDRFLAFKENAKETVVKNIIPTQENNLKQKTFQVGQADAGLSFVAQAETLARQATSITDLKEKVSSFEGCALKKTALNTFIGVGKEKNPAVFCIFDAPKAGADKTGNLFEGPQGLLMQKMLGAIHLSLENTFVAPLIPWRLPGDRKPSLTEEKICTPFIQKTLSLTNPDFILVFGAVPTRALLGIESISKARQQTNFLTINGREIPVISTFGPDMVSASQTSRKNAWDDLKKLAQLIQEKASNNEEDN
jgi:DNA polymerase